MTSRKPEGSRELRVRTSSVILTSNGPWISKGPRIPHTIDPNSGIPNEVQDATQAIQTDGWLPLDGFPHELLEGRRQQLLNALRSRTIFDESHAILPGSTSLSGSYKPPRSRKRASVSSPESKIRFPESEREISNSRTLPTINLLRAQLDRIEPAAPRTCQWLYDRPEYKRWRNSKKPLDNVLLVLGGLATGKTILVKSICNRLESENSFVVPFFCKREVTTYYVFASFVYYLLMRFKELSRYITKQHLATASGYSVAEICGLFFDLTADELVKDHVFVIDALDQCDEFSYNELASTFYKRRNDIGAKVLITSRIVKHTPHMKNLVWHIEINPIDLASDVHAILDYELENAGVGADYSTELFGFIRNEIEQEVNGMLLIIVAKLRDFRLASATKGFSTSPEYLRDLFRRMPKMLERYYLSEITPIVHSYSDKVRAADATRIFNVLLAAQQESFTESELKSAFENSYVGERLAESETDIFDTALRLCGPLIRIRQSNGTRYLEIDHPATKTFLTESGNIASPDPVQVFLSQISLTAGHLLLARACLRSMLSLRERKSGYSTAIAKDPFLLYSLRNWPIHIRECGEEVREIEDLIKKFLSPICHAYRQWSLLSRITRRVFGKCPGWWAKPYPIASIIIQEKLVNLWPLITKSSVQSHAVLCRETIFDLEELDDMGRTPLISALDRDQYDVAETILDLGATVQRADLSGVTPLHVAVKKNQKDLVFRLLESGALINAEGKLSDGAQAESVLFTSVHTAMDNIDIFRHLLQSHPVQLFRSSDKWSILHEAVLHEAIDKVDFILRGGLIEVNVQSHDGRTPLIIAAGASRKSFDLSQLLLKHGADATLKTNAGSTALYEAAYRGNTDTVNLLLPFLDTSMYGKGGLVPLIAASLTGHDEIVQLLLDSPMDPDAITTDGDTALIVATREKHVKVIQKLLRASAETSLHNKAGQTALLIASSMGREDIFVPLLRASRHPEIASTYSQNSWSCLHAAAYSGCLPIVRSLIEARKKPVVVDEVYVRRQWTPLHVALRQNNVGVAKYLLSKGADPTKKSDTLWTSLHMVCFYCSDEELLRMILRKVSDDLLPRATHRASTALNLTAENFTTAYCSDEELEPVGRNKTLLNLLSAVTNRGSTALSLAAEKGFAAAVEILVTEYHVRTLVRNKLGCTPLYYAANIGSEHAVRTLMIAEYLADVRSDIGLTALHAACQTCGKEVVKMLMRVTNWALRPSPALTPLHVAIGNNNEEAFQTLLDGDFPPDLPSGWGSTPVLEAASFGNVAMVTQLLQRGVAVDKFDWDYRHPLNGAYRSRATSLFEQLRPNVTLSPRATLKSLESLLHGAAAISLDEVIWAIGRGMYTSARDVYHYTPLAVACFYGHTEILEYLLDQPDNWKQVDARGHITGWTPLHISTRLRHSECINVLVEKTGIDPNTKDCFGLTAFDYAYGHVPSWLALAPNFPRLAKHCEMKKQEQQQTQLDINFVCKITDWRLRELKYDDYQFLEADGQLTAQLMAEAYIRLDDIENATVAVDMYLGPPSQRLDHNILCQMCLRNSLDSVFICRSCPVRNVCRDCRNRTQDEDVAGCYQHAFLEAPSPSWFNRDVKFVNEDGETEKEWLERVRLVYEAKKDPDYDSSNIVLFFESSPNPLHLFSFASNSDYTEFSNHLHQFPRDIAIRDDLGNSLAMHLLLLEDTSDAECLDKLQRIVTHGAKLLTANRDARTTIQIACEKKFELSACFILGQWDPAFDSIFGASSSSALEMMKDYEWRGALALVIERHFEWAAQGKFSYLRDLSRDRMTDAAMLDALLSSGNSSESPTTTGSGGPWIPWSASELEKGLLTQAHSAGCVHGVIDGQLGMLAEGESETSSGMSSVSKFAADDSDQGSDIFGVLDIIENAIARCGIGGLFPDSATSTVFSETTDSSGRRDASISYKSKADELPGMRKVDTTVMILIRAGSGLLDSISEAQSVGLCCQSFTVPCMTAQRSQNGSRIVQLTSVSFEDVFAFVTQIQRLSFQEQPQWLKNTLNECMPLALTILDCLFKHIDMPVINLARNQLHCCALAMQFLCLGFESFLAGHLYNLQLPIISCKVSKFRLLGTEDGPTFELAPVDMACVSQMIRDQILVFSSRSTIDIDSEKLTELGCYLLANITEMLEIWGPFVCVGERSVTGKATGSFLAAHVREGILQLTGVTENGFQCAHWGRMSTLQSSARPFRPYETLLVGMLVPNALCRWNAQRELVMSRMQLDPLDTRDDFWEITQNSIQPSVSLYWFHLTYSRNWQRQRGVTMKRNIILQWEGESGRLDCLNQPFGLILSICTGFAQRVPLRVAVAKVLDHYENVVVGGPLFASRRWDEIHAVRTRLRQKLAGTGYGSLREANQAFRDYVANRNNELEEWQGGYIKCLICYILRVLENTGYDPGSDTFRIASPTPENPTSSFRFRLSQINEFRWLKIMRDTTKTAAFVIATNRCLVPHRAPQVPYGPGTSCRSHIFPGQYPEGISGFHLLATRVLPTDSVIPRRWRLERNIQYALPTGGGRPIIAKVDYLEDHNAGIIVKFLIIWRSRDNIGSPLDTLRRCNEPVIYIMEDCLDLWENPMPGCVLITTRSHWLKMRARAENLRH